MSSRRTLGRKWIDNRWAVKPSTFSGVLEAIARIGALDSTQRYVWRGSADWSWGLQPSVFRTPELVGHEAWTREAMEQALTDYETRLLDQAFAWGLYRRQGALASDLDVLAQIQHNRRGEKLGTRLLDVTPNPYTALYFACAKWNVTGMVYAINVTDAVRISTQERTVRGSMLSAPPPRGNLARELGQLGDRLGVLRPEFPDERMRAQEGEFLISRCPRASQGRSGAGIDGIAISPPKSLDEATHSWLAGETSRTRGRPSGVPVFGVAVGSSLKRRLREVLANTYRREERSIFPDVSGFVDGFS